MKRGTRIEFLAGHRARADYARKHTIVKELSAALTCAPADIVEAVGKLSSTVVEVRRALATYRERDLDEEAIRLRTTATSIGAISAVLCTFEGRPIDEIKGLALRLTAEPDVIVLFGIGGQRTQLIFARSENVTVDLKVSFDRALAALGGGKGGGGRVLMGSAAAVDEIRLASALNGAESDVAYATAQHQA
jgi:alanyl-tRNA synthetase